MTLIKVIMAHKSTFATYTMHIVVTDRFKPVEAELL